MLESSRLSATVRGFREVLLVRWFLIPGFHSLRCEVQRNSLIVLSESRFYPSFVFWFILLAKAERHKLYKLWIDI